MKKINNKGFVLVETIIVAVFVIGICTFLFTNFLPLIADYERVSTYDNVEYKYKVHEIRKMLLREIDNDTNKLNTLFSTSSYERYQNYDYSNSEGTFRQNQLCDNLNSKNYCNKLLGENYLDVEEIIITPFKLSSFKQTVKNSTEFNRSLKEYVDYLPDYNKYPSKYDNYYRIIAIFRDGSLANIEVYYEIG